MHVSRRHFWSAASVATMLVLWWIGSILFPSVLPGLAGTAVALVEIVTSDGPYGKPFYYHVYKTALMIFISLAVSLILGTILGVALGTNETLEEGVSSWIYAWLAIPSLVIVFVAGIWIGFDATAGYFAVPLVITPFVALNMWEGAHNLESNLDEMADFFGADRYQTFRDVIIPQLVPFLFASVRSGLSIGWKIALLVEALLLTRGVGFMFKYYFDQYDLRLMVGWIIVFVLFLIVIEYGVIVPIRNRVTHWRPEIEGVRAAE